MNRLELEMQIRNTKEYLITIQDILKNAGKNGPTHMYYNQMLHDEGSKLKKLEKMYHEEYGKHEEI